MQAYLAEADWERLAQLTPAWEPLAVEQAGLFLRELQGEVGPGHPLYLFLTRRAGYDDFLVYASSLALPWVSVHLTWTFARYGRTECPPWPFSYPYPSLEAFCHEQETE